MIQDPLDLQPTLQNHSPGSLLFGRYRLVRLLSRGSRGDIWEAMDERLSLAVAVKLVTDVEYADKLLEGAGKAMELTHPNVIRTFDVLREDQLLAVITEFVKGKSLAELLREKPQAYDWEEIKPWAQQLFSGLSFAWDHSKVVHADLRLANLVIGPGNNLKIADFPFAAIRAGRSVLELNAQSTAGVSLPTLSPQLVAGESATHADDVYAGGACLYELLTGKPVFPGGNVIAQIERKVPPTLSDRRKELEVRGKPTPRAAEEVIAQCLAKDRSERPTAMSAVTRLDLGAATNADAGKQGGGATAELSRPTTDLLTNLWQNAAFRRSLGVAAVFAIGFLGFYQPSKEELALRRAKLSELIKADSALAVPVSLEETKAKISEAELHRKAWLRFVDDYENEAIMFFSEDDRQIKEAKRAEEDWQTQIAALKASNEDHQNKQQKLVDALSSRFSDLKKEAAEIKSKAELVDFWNAAHDELNVPASMAIPDYVDTFQTIIKRRDEAQLAFEREKADQFQVTFNQTQSQCGVERLAETRRELWQKLLSEHDTPENKKIAAMESILKDARSKIQQEELVIKEMGPRKVAWLRTCTEDWAAIQQTIANPGELASAKVSRLESFLKQLENELGTGDTGIAVVRDQASKALEEQRKLAQPPPTKPLALTELFANSQYKAWPDAKKGMVLKNAQLILFSQTAATTAMNNQGTGAAASSANATGAVLPYTPLSPTTNSQTTPAPRATAPASPSATSATTPVYSEEVKKKADGKTGPGTHKAICDYQGANHLAMNGQLDDPTLAKLGLAGKQQDDPIFKVTSTAPSAGSAGSAGGGSNSGGSSKIKSWEGREPSRGYYEAIGLGLIRLKADTVGGKINSRGGYLKPDAKKDKFKRDSWNYHINTWVPYCEWCERQ